MSNAAETSTPNSTPNSKPPLHNFSLPPFLKWVTQKILRCTKPPSSRSHHPTRCSESSDQMIQSSLIEVSHFHASPETAAARPWNLRTRRSACNAPPHLGRREKVVENPNGKMGLGMKMKMMRVRKLFSAALSKEEIEFDILKLFGTRPPRRPKKRPRILQRQVDLVCPGLWMTEITADRYKVHDYPEPLKG